MTKKIEIPENEITTKPPKLKKLKKAMNVVADEHLCLGDWSDFDEIHNELVKTIRETSASMAETSKNTELLSKMGPLVAKSYIIALTTLAKDLKAYMGDLTTVKTKYDGKTGKVYTDDDDADLYWNITATYSKIGNIMAETTMSQLAEIGVAVAEVEYQGLETTDGE